MCGHSPEAEKQKVKQSYTLVFLSGWAGGSCVNKQQQMAHNELVLMLAYGKGEAGESFLATKATQKQVSRLPLSALLMDVVLGMSGDVSIRDIIVVTSASRWGRI